MRPENFKFGGGVNDSILHPLVLLAMLLGIVLVLTLPRKYASIPLLCLSFLVPVGQQVVIGGVHFFPLRFLILAGLARFAFWRFRTQWRHFPAGFGTIDKLFLGWALCRATAFVLLFHATPAVVNQVGFLWDSVGAFFLLRFIIQDDKDIERVIKTLAVLAVILATTMAYEHYKGLNVFALLGGLPVVPEIRNGLYRAQGPFGHALLAGTFGATLLPLFVWLWIIAKARTLAAFGIAASTIMALAATCSTPIMAYGAGVAAMCMWPLRKRMRAVRWGLVLLLVCLHLVMKAPVWYSISHVDLVGGSSSDHRAQLLNLFITRVSDWWLVGTDSNANWGWDMWDTSNQFVAEGWTGGLATLACFIAMIAVGFSRLGKARKAVAGDKKKEIYFWLLGTTLFAHVVAFFGISYFDQTRMIWYALFAMISVAVAPALARKAELVAVTVEVADDALRLPYDGDEIDGPQVTPSPWWDDKTSHLA